MRVTPILSIVLAFSVAACGRSAPVPAPVPVAVVAEPDSRPIAVGQTLEGVLTTDDATWGSNGRFHLYRFDAAAGERLAIEMRSEDFDAYLVVGDRSGGVFNPIDQDDDSGGDLDARIRFVAPRAGTYWVLAQALAEYGLGAYTLSLSPLPEPRPVVPTPIAVGASALGELSEEDAVQVDEGQFYDVYTFPAVAGRRYAIVMSSPAFDSYLLLGRGTTDFQEIARDDDSAGDLDSRIVFTADQSGTYAIRATSFGSDATGEYSLNVTELPPPGPVTVTALDVGESATGTLDFGDGVSDDGSFHDTYAFRGTEGQRISITMRSSDFDSYLELGEAGEEFNGDYSDDDSGGGLDSRIVATLWRTGTFHVRASSLYGNETGAYSIQVEELPPPGPVTIQPITVGQTVRGALEPSDAMLDDGSHYDIYTFNGAAGQQLRITLRSSDFDAYLSFGEWQNGIVDITEQDDDGAGGLDSQILVTLPRTGTYAIQANSLRADATGDYAVSLEEQ